MPVVDVPDCSYTFVMCVCVCVCVCVSGWMASVDLCACVCMNIHVSEFHAVSRGNDNCVWFVTRELSGG